VAAAGHLEVLLPIARSVGELPLALEGLVSQRRGEALGERGIVAPDAQYAALKRDAVRPAHAPLIEVLHDQPVAGLGRTDDADRTDMQSPAQTRLLPRRSKPHRYAEAGMNRPPPHVLGSTTFKWLDGGHFIIERSHNDHELRPRCALRRQLRSVARRVVAP
jgi:hypothetical protein